MIRNTLFLLMFIAAAPALAVDTILVNGKIVTVDDQFRVVQALAITKERIVATGSAADGRCAGCEPRVWPRDHAGDGETPDVAR